MTRILFLAANPNNADTLLAGDELRQIEAALKNSQFEVIAKPAAQLDDLRELLLHYKPQIVHFSGHGSRYGELMFVNDQGESESAPIEALAELFRLFNSQVRCVILNACYSDEQANAISSQIDCVLGVEGQIRDDAARAFSAGFYSTLASGESIASAREHGSNEIGLRYPDALLPCHIGGRSDSNSLIPVNWDSPRSAAGSANPEGVKVEGDWVSGDKVGGDKTSVGNIDHSMAVAVGTNATATVNITEEAAYNVQGLVNPYLGLRDFRYEDRAIYAGREQLALETIERLTSPGAQQTLLFITGASGSGKSSFAQAGLLPGLRDHYEKRHKKVAIACFRPGDQPLARLDDALSQLTPNISRDLSVITPADQVNVLVIDQFEEVFTQAQLATDTEFFQWLQQIPTFEQGRTHVIVTVRSDYLNELFNIERLYDLNRFGLNLRTMSLNELSETIQYPLQVGFPKGEKRFEPALVQKLAKDASERATLLPLLQVTLQTLWKKGNLKLAAYTNLTDAIQQTAEEVYKFSDHLETNPVKQRSKQSQQELLGILLDLVKVSIDDADRRDVRKPQLRNELEQASPQRPRLIEELVNARLLATTSETRNGEKVEVIDIIHESLIDNWDRLRKAIEAQREQLQRRARFTFLLKDWLDNGRQDRALLTDLQLAQAQALAERHDIELQNPDAQNFYRRSWQHLEANRQRELENQRQLAAEQSRRALIFRNAVIVAGVLMLISLGLAEWGRRSSNRALNNAATATIALATSDASLMEAGKQRDRANQEAENAATRAAEARIAQATSERSKNFAQSQSLATISNSEQKNKPMRALLLAIEAGLRGDTVQAFTELNRQITDKALPIFTLFHSSDLAYVMWSEDGTKILTLSKDNTIHIWDGRDGHLLFKLQYSSTVMDVQWHGSYILTRSDNTVFIWDINNGHHLSAIKHVFPGDQGFWPDASFPLKGAQLRTDGDQVLTWGADLVCVWSSSSAKNLLLLKNTAEVAGAQWNINQDRILVWDKSNQMSIWDAANGQRLVSMSFEGYINGVRWSNDSQKLVTRNYDDQTRSDFADVWNIKDGKKLSTLKHTNDILGLEWSHDDTQIVTWGYEDNAVVWDSMTGQRLITLTHSNSNDILGARWSHDISRILTWENGNPVSVWDSRDGEELLSLRDGGLYAVWNSDESQIATWGFDDVARIWDANTGTQILALAHENLNAGPTYAKGYFTSDLWSNDAPPMSKIRQVQWNKDSNRILTWSGNNFVKVWDAKKNPELPILTHENALWAFWNEQENRIVTAGNDGTVRIWNESDGKLLLDLSFDLVKKKDDPMLEYYAEQVELSPDGLQLARWGTDNIVRVLNIMDGSYLFNLQHEGIVGGVRWSQDSHYLLSWGDENNARIWDAVTGQQLLELPHQNHILGATWNWQGTRILTRSSDQMVSVWDANNGKKLLSLPHEHNVNRAWWDESEQHIITLADSNNTVRIWNSQTGQLLDSPMALGILRDPVYWSIDNSRNRVLTWSHAGNYVKVSNLFDIRKSYTITDKPDNVIEALWSPNDKYILIYGGESARIWDSITGKILRTLRHNSSVTGAEWNSDATKVLTWEILGDNIGRVWDIKTGEVIMELNNGGNHFTRGNWNQDNSQIMYITSGTIVRSYTNISKIITSACKLVTRNLTWSEWQRYLPTEPYRRTCPNLPEGIGVSSDNSDTSTPSADFTQVVSVHDAATLITLPSQPDSPLTIYPNSPLLTPGE